MLSSQKGASQGPGERESLLIFLFALLSSQASMLSGKKGVKYGLEIRKPGAKPKPALPAKKPSAFAQDDSDEDTGADTGNFDREAVNRRIAAAAAEKAADPRVNMLVAACSVLHCCALVSISCAAAAQTDRPMSFCRCTSCISRL